MWGWNIPSYINLHGNLGLIDRQCCEDSTKVNPIFLCRVWVTLDINPEYGLMDRSCPDDSKNVWQKKSHGTGNNIFMRVGNGLVLMIMNRYDTCM